MPRGQRQGRPACKRFDWNGQILGGVSDKGFDALRGWGIWDMRHSQAP
jgi:hypothetical protein